MADISTFPTITNDALYVGDNIQSFTCGADIKVGMVVAFHGTGVSRTLHPAVKGTTGTIFGVALGNADSGDKVAVAGRGCIVEVANADASTGIDAGDPCEDNDNAVGGTVSAATLVDAGVVAVVKIIAGFAVDDIAGGATGLMEVAPQYLTSANNA